MSQLSVDLWNGGDCIGEFNLSDDDAIVEAYDLARNLVRWSSSRAPFDVEAHVMRGGEIIHAVVNHDDILPCDYTVEVLTIVTRPTWATRDSKPPKGELHLPTNTAAKAVMHSWHVT